MIGAGSKRSGAVAQDSNTEPTVFLMRASVIPAFTCPYSSDIALRLFHAYNLG